MGARWILKRVKMEAISAPTNWKIIVLKFLIWLVVPLEIFIYIYFYFMIGGKFTMNNTTYSVKKNEIERKWYIIDAENKPLGRVASEAAKLLRGKHKPTFTPNMDMGDYVIITNCSKAILTGKKLNQKVYTHFTGYIGNMKKTLAKDMMEQKPEKAMMIAIKGMLPHNSLGRQMLTKLRVYAGAEHENAAQKPEVWKF